jgi:hypothetical protein
LGNLTVKLQHLFYQQSRRNQWVQQFFTTSTNFLLHTRTSRSLCAILFLVFYKILLLQSLCNWSSPAM